tara:strand:+ start:3676 stop:4698 length:1023 start_codon:yes stop_codon:yes gene_type:complete
MGQIEGLLSWDAVKELLTGNEPAPHERPSLLVGNGASIAVSDRFGYSTLRNEATLTDLAAQLFETVGTSDFELVLHRLGTGLMINRVCGLDTQVINEAYEQIKAALIAAVREVHLPRNNYHPNGDLGDEFKSYCAIYSTNYDLLLYWAMLNAECHVDNAVVDLFKGRRFDRDQEYNNDSTRLMYLHGALHLFIDSQSVCRKRRNLDLSILDQLNEDGIARVHFVSEGTWQAKWAKILSSDYLRYCHEQLRRDSGNIVVFGHSLNPETDQHILNALLRHPNRFFAVSLYIEGLNNQDIHDTMNQYRVKLRGVDAERILFFDSSTHPLGVPGQDNPFACIAE